jgi:hypothetical protein
MELLQFALFSSKGGVVGVDVVDEEASRKNFLVAEDKMNGSKANLLNLKKEMP